MSIYTGFDYADNTTRLAAYLRRSADYQAADPEGWRWRQMAGDAIKKRIRQGPRKANVFSLLAKRAKR